MPTLTLYPVLGRARTGAWCEVCALPSAVSYTVYGLPATTGHRIPNIIRLGALRACMDCGEVARVLDQ